MNTIVLDKEAVRSQLTSVVSAMDPIDGFWGMLAAIPKNSKLVGFVKDMGGCTDMTDAGEVWHFDRTMASAKSWFGSSTDSTAGGGARQRMIDSLFGPFDPENTDPNCIEPLGELSSLENEIGAAGGSVTEYQRRTIVSKLDALHSWLTAQQQSMAEGFGTLNGARNEIQRIHDVCRADNTLYAFWVGNDPSGNLAKFISFQKQVIARAEAIQVPFFELGEAWSTLIGMVSDVATHIGNAQLIEVNSVFQQIDIGFSLKAWPVLCNIAGDLQPKSTFTIPPPPPGFG